MRETQSKAMTAKIERYKKDYFGKSFHLAINTHAFILAGIVDGVVFIMYNSKVINHYPVAQVLEFIDDGSWIVIKD